MRSRLLSLAVLSVALFFAWIASGHAQYPHQPQGGRPGEFHFILHEQLQQDRAQFRDVRATIDILRYQVSRSKDDAATQRDMLNSLERLRLFVDSMETQLTTSASPTALLVERKLNTIKGDRQCGACHGGLAEVEPVPTILYGK